MRSNRGPYKVWGLRLACISQEEELSAVGAVVLSLHRLVQSLHPQGGTLLWGPAEWGLSVQASWSNWPLFPCGIPPLLALHQTLRGPCWPRALFHKRRPPHSTSQGRRGSREREEDCWGLLVPHFLTSEGPVLSISCISRVVPSLFCLKEQPQSLKSGIKPCSRPWRRIHTKSGVFLAFLYGGPLRESDFCDAPRHRHSYAIHHSGNSKKPPDFLTRSKILESPQIQD